MAVKTYSLRNDGNKQLSAHFKVREFRCKDGTDKILIEDELVSKALEPLRAALCKKYNQEVSINIVSGYRTKSHNKAVGGSSTSKHLTGKAADIECKIGDKIIPAYEICCIAQDLDLDGIAYINNNRVHIDTRGSQWWVDETKNNKKITDFYAYFGVSYPEPTATVKKGDKGTSVRWVQKRLNRHGYKLTVDGSFGGGTDKIVRAFQKAKGLAVDGKVGPATRAALKK